MEYAAIIIAKAHSSAHCRAQAEFYIDLERRNLGLGHNLPTGMSSNKR